MIPESAYRAATNSIFEDDPRITESDAYDLASNALEAALPHIEAALRQQIAAEIQALMEPPGETFNSDRLFFNAGIQAAALSVLNETAEEGATK